MSAINISSVKERESKQICVSIVIPALNEELTIGEFVKWCHQGLKDAGVNGEILIIDSSNDRTAEIAQSLGARVIKVPKRGLGQAYIDAIPHILGKYVIMGDCDCTYDFRQIKQFIDKLDEGYDYIMGTRMKGYIEPGAMPPLHRYFGTPLTTAILNFMYGSSYSDIHCGMRAMTTDALKKINIESTSWEYASEMVLKTAKLDLKTTEVPIRFYKEPEGRLSHHKRVGWFSPWYAGWINLRAMFLYAPDFFLMKPGLISLIIGLAFVISLAGGPITIGKITFSLHWMLLGVTMTVLGFSAFQMGMICKVFYNFQPKIILTYKRFLTYNRGVITGGILTAVGILISLHLLINYIISGMQLGEISQLAILGLMMIILGFQTFTFTLIFHMIINRQEKTKKLLKENLDECE